jgi:dTDP-4-amino-4,6-dideoxygalactose transaminase
LTIRRSIIPNRNAQANIDLHMKIEKLSLSDLAYFGGTPTFPEPLHVGKPYLYDRTYFLDEVENILDSRYYTNGGPVLSRFEDSVASLTGVKHCVAVCNGTKALEISARALNLTGEVIIPAFTFIATAHALYWQGIKPVFCDIEADTHQIDTSKIESLITPSTTGILAVHLWGSPCNVDALENIAKTHNLKLLFDASHSFGTTYKNRAVGGFGNAEAVSFHATKLVNTFEGGAILTNDDSLAERARLLTNFGFTDYDKVSSIGTNGKLSEIHAAMGLACLRRIELILSANNQRYMLYKKLLKNVDGVRLVTQLSGSNHQYTVIEVTTDIPNARDILYSVLQK